MVGTQRREDEEMGLRPKLNSSVEYVLDYLINEGYTDSYDSATYILEAMSDEWLDEILIERTRFAKKTGRSATSGRPSQKGGLKASKDPVDAAILSTIQRIPSLGIGARMGASKNPIPGGGVGSRQTKKIPGAKTQTTPRKYATNRERERMRRKAEREIGSRFD